MTFILVVLLVTPYATGAAVLNNTLVAPHVDGKTNADAMDNPGGKEVMERNLPAEIALITKIAGVGQCDTNEGTMTNCNIDVGGADYVVIDKDKIMVNVAINCDTTAQNCILLKSGTTLNILYKSVITGTNKGRFITLEADAELVLNDVKGSGFGKDNLYGGFIYSVDGNYKITIKNSEINNNKGNHGGALYLKEAGKLEISGSMFASNTAASEGGAIYSIGVSGDRSKASWIITDATFSANIAKASCGAIQARTLTATVDNVKVIGNEAKGGVGGGVGMWESTFSFKCSLFAYNTAKSDLRGGAIFSNSASDIALTTTVFSGNIGKDINNDVYCYDKTTVTRDLYFPPLYYAPLKITGKCVHKYATPEEGECPK